MHDTYKPEIGKTYYATATPDSPQKAESEHEKWMRELMERQKRENFQFTAIMVTTIILCIILGYFMIKADARSDKEQANDRKTMDAGTYCEKWEGRRYAYHLSGYCFSYYNGR